MADIDIQRKSTPVWPWILGIIVAVAIILFLVAGRDRDTLDNYGGGALETPGTEPTTQPLEPTPENPAVPAQPTPGHNPQVAPPTQDQLDNRQQPTQPTIPESTSPNPNDGANLNYKPADTMFTDQLVQQDLTLPNDPPTDPPTDENSAIIIEEEETIDLDEEPIFLDDRYPAEVAAFSQFLIQNSDTQADASSTFTADGLRNLASALYVTADQSDVTTEINDQNRDDLNLLADQIADSPNDADQANLTADAFSLAAAWVQDISTTLYPETENQALAVQEAADNFDPEGQLSTQLPAVRAFFDRADTALQIMSES